MANNIVETIVKLRGSREFQQAARTTAKSVLGIGDSTEQAGKKAGLGWKGVAKWAGGTAALYGAGKFLKDAVKTTETLSKSTMALERSTGLDAKQASAWAAVTRARGIDTTKFQMALTKVSRTLEQARAGSKTAIKTLDQLGISQNTIATGNVQQALFETADAYSTMENPAQKAALAQQLFGRQALALAPLLGAGSEGMQKQLEMADKLGLTLNEKTVEGTKNTAAAQRMLTMATDGLKVQLGTALLPAIEGVVAMLVKLAMILQPLLRNTTFVTSALGLLTTAFLVNKAAALAASLAQLGLTRAFISARIAAIALALGVNGINASLLLIPLAIAAVVIGVVVLYNKWKWFHDAVNNTFAWIKSHWPLLLAILTGPIGLAILAIVKNFGAIKAAFRNVLNWMIDRLNSVIGFINKAIGAFNRLPGHDIGKLGVIGHMAAGGVAQRTGPYLVGERGPEVVSLRSGSAVFPTRDVAPLGAVPGLDGGGGQTIVTKVYLNRRQIAEAVGQYASDQRARR